MQKKNRKKKIKILFLSESCAKVVKNFLRLLELYFEILLRVNKQVLEHKYNLVQRFNELIHGTCSLLLALSFRVRLLAFRKAAFFLEDVPTIYY